MHVVVVVAAVVVVAVVVVDGVVVVVVAVVVVVVFGVIDGSYCRFFSFSECRTVGCGCFAAENVEMLYLVHCVQPAEKARK